MRLFEFEERVDPTGTQQWPVEKWKTISEEDFERELYDIEHELMFETETELETLFIIKKFLEKYRRDFLPFCNRQISRANSDIESHKKYDAELALKQKKQAAVADQLDHSVVYYRGSRKKGTGAVPNQGFGGSAMFPSAKTTFVTDNPYLAASYAGPEGWVTSMLLKPKYAIIFNSGRHHSMTQFDDESGQVRKETVLVVRDITDRGPFRDNIDQDKSLAASTHVAFTDPSVAHIIGEESAKKYFNSDETVWD